MNLLQKLQGMHVLVVGDLMVDRYYWGRASRISPEAPVPVMLVQHEESRLGGACNTAHNLVQLGIQVSLLGVVGQDATADTMRQALNKVGIDDGYLITDDSRPTTLKLRMMALSQQLLRCDWEKCHPLVGANLQSAMSAIKQLVDEVDGVIVSDYGKGVVTLELMEALRACCVKANKLFVVDPKGSDYSKYQGAACITPNEKEAMEATATSFEADTDIEHAATQLMNAYQLQSVCITLGPRGVLAQQQADPPIWLPTEALEVYDVTGAGETFVSVLGALLIAKQPFSDAVKWANQAAGMVVAKPGTAVVSGENLFLTSVGGKKVLSLTEAATTMERLRIQGKRVVFTNGCFDLLHAGHAHCLTQARKLGDVLVVAVNSDRSVQQLKGTSRPINPQNERAQLLAALACVDYVVIFDEDTPLELITLLSPDVLVKGGDYQPHEVVGAEWVNQKGGTVKVIPLLEGLSSSHLIQKVAETL